MCALVLVQVGLGADVGGSVAASVNEVMSPMIHRQLERIISRSSTMQDLREEPSLRSGFNFVVSAACNSVGVGVAFYCEQMVRAHIPFF